MPTRAPQIVALGGGGFSVERDSTLLDDYVLSHSPARGHACASCPQRPATPTTTSCASIDASPPTARPATSRCSGATRARTASRTTSRPPARAGPHLRRRRQHAQHARRLARARAGRMLRRAWRAGIVMCGPSAGSLCWFQQALSAFHGSPGRTGLGLLPYSNCVHYDAERERRAEYHRAVAQGMRGGSPPRTASRCTSAARAHRVVTSRAAAGAYRVTSRAARVRETRLDVERAARARRPRAAATAHARRARARGHAPAAGRGGGVTRGRAFAMTRGSIFAMGGGGFTMEPNNPLLDDFVLSLTRAPSRASCSCRPPRATPPRRSTPSRRASRTAPASPSTSRSSA